MVRREFEGGLLLITQTAHAWISGQLALRWGNEAFYRPEPWEILTLTAGQHDNGWAEWELAPRILPDGRPVSFTEMALEEHFAIWQRSAERMQSTNLYAALLISMHATDLFQRRLQADERGDTPELQSRIRGFIEEQQRFQASLYPILADHPRYGPALAQERLDVAFRLLQIWDLLSLLMLMGPLPTRRLEDVPAGPGERTTVQILPRDERTMVLEPYPFAEAPFVVRVDGRWLAQKSFGHNALFRRALEQSQLLSLQFVIDRRS
jgi:hypothetical protein